MVDQISNIENPDVLVLTKEMIDNLNTYEDIYYGKFTTTEVYCTIQFEALHHWKTCDIDEVSFLRFPHRHIFWIRAYKQVSHSDRAVEFIVLKRNIQKYLDTKYPDHDFGSQSCEMIATELLEEFNLTRCDVSEDNENGAVVQRR